MTFSAHARPRIMRGDEIAMGPGKADLLEAIGRTGSISMAAKGLQMSYRRAWLLVETMNACFMRPLVESSRGGSGGGGAKVTAAGEAVLGEFRRMQDEIARVMEAHLPAFEAQVGESQR
jgi:molybdate transport system regulatory protein